MTEIIFNDSTNPTLGVEWEFGIVDKKHFDLVNGANDFFHELNERYPDYSSKIHKELFENTIELTSGVSQNAAQAIDDIKDSFEKVNNIIEKNGWALYGAGTHPFADWTKQNITQVPRYQAYDEKFCWWGRQMLIWGLHVHVGISAKDRIMPLIEAILYYLPHILVLSASSPYLYNVDTGYASNRTMLFQQLSSAGIPDSLNSWREFEKYIKASKNSNSFSALNELRWDIRPSPHLGTIELRINDSFSTFWEAKAVTAFIHCLIVYLDRAIAQGNLEKLTSSLKPWFNKENKWRATRYGIDAKIITDNEGNTSRVDTAIKKTVEQLLPTSEQLNCRDDLVRVIDILEKNPSYVRQKIVFEKTGDLVSVAKHVTNELLD